jgi:large subunit ribosomal protein L5
MAFYETFKSKITPALQKELGIKNIMAVPRLKAVKVNVGIGSITRNTKDFSDVIENLAKITGQKSVITKAKIAISNFKLREGMPVGLVTTLRGKNMYEFIYRLVNVALPRVRDFRGLSPKAFDGKGNYNIGLKEALVFPEINPDNVLNVHGLQVTIVTTAKNDEEGLALLRQIGFPFKKES